MGSYPWLMLISRPVLFALFPLLIALGLMMTGTESAWDASSPWWTFVVILTNLVSIYLLNQLYHAEGKRFLDLFGFHAMPGRKTCSGF